MRDSIRARCEHLFVPPRSTRFTEPELREAIALSRSWAETLRRLKYRSAGGNWRTLQKYAALWNVPTDHFDPNGQAIAGLRRSWPKKRLLEEILVRDSTFSRNHLKERLFLEGLKARVCEECGQGDEWRGKPMALILDHVNGVPNDHRLENLRILCPNCAATLPTHCGRKNRRPPQACERCGREFIAKYRKQRFCSRECGTRYSRDHSKRYRRVERPPYAHLLKEIEEMGYLAVGRKYGVSDNAVRKWVRFYERQIERENDEAEGEQIAADGGATEADAA